MTRNTEYYVKDRLCIGVRDRMTEVWLDGHLALGRALTGSVRVLLGGAAVPRPELPLLGEALYFADDGPELITSTLTAVERPSLQAMDDLVS